MILETPGKGGGSLKTALSRGTSIKHCCRGTAIFAYFISSKLLKIELSPARDLNFRCFENAFDRILREPNKALSALSTRGLINMGKAKRVTHKVYDLYEELLRRGEGNVAFISFDKYLTEPEAQTKEICDFIGEEFSPAMLDGPRRNTRYPGEGFDASKIGKEEYDFDTMDKDLVSIVRRYQSLREHAL